MAKNNMPVRRLGDGTRRPAVHRLTVAILAAALLAGCGAQGLLDRPPGGSGRSGKVCTDYRDRSVRVPYCAQRAARTCNTNSAGQQSCFGGGYCASTSYRTTTVRECIAYRCEAGLINAEGGCFTAEQLDARRQWRSERAMSIVAKETRKSKDDPGLLVSVSNAFAYGLHSLPKDRQLAFEYARRACDQDLGSGCGLLADYYEDTFNDPVQLADGTELVADAAEARALRERACELEAAQYCGLLGQRMLADIDALPEAEREQQRAEALAYLERSCEIGNGSGCTLIAELYLKGSIPSDRKAADAVRYYERVCNNNAPASAGYASYQCVRASTLYYHGGDGLPKSPDKALALANRAAALYPQGDELYRTTIDCMRTGDGFCGLSQKEIDVLEAESTITDITTASAEELLTEAKRINFLGDHTRKQRELEELLAARSCELGSISGCFFLSQLLWYTKERLPGSSDIAAQIRKDQARDVLAKACDQALPSACYRLGLITLYDSFVAYVRFVIVAYTDPKPLAAGADVARGVELIERACELGGLSACQTAGLIHGAGYDERFASADIALARFRKACDMGNAVLSPTSCMLAARLLYNAGTGVSQDREEARRLTLIARDLAQQDDPIKFTEKSTLWVSKIGQCVLQGRNECL